MPQNKKSTDMLDSLKDRREYTRKHLGKTKRNSEKSLTFGPAIAT